MDESRTSRSLIQDPNDLTRDILSICKDHKLTNKPMYPRDQTSNTITTSTTEDGNRLYGQNEIDRQFLFDQSQSFDDLMMFSHGNCNNKQIQHKFCVTNKNSPELIGPMVGPTRTMSYDWNKTNHIQQNIPYRIVMKNNQNSVYPDNRLCQLNKRMTYPTCLNTGNTNHNINNNNTSTHPHSVNNAIHFANGGGYPRIQKPQTYNLNESHFERPKTQRFAQWQIDILESYFKKSFYVSKEEKIKISEETGLSVRQISVWFQNRRAKKKR